MSTVDIATADVERIAASVATFLRVDRAALAVEARPTDDGYPTPGAYTITHTGESFWPVRFVDIVEAVTRVRESVPADWFLDAYGEHTLCVSPIVEPERVNSPARALAAIRTMLPPSARGRTSYGYVDVHAVIVPAALTVTHIDGTADTVPAGYYVLTVNQVTAEPLADAYDTIADMRCAARRLTAHR